MERGSKVLFPPPQPGPSEKVSVIHQLRYVQRLIMKNHIIPELPYGTCSCYPPNFPSCIGNLRTYYGGVLEEMIHEPTVKSSILLNPGVEFPPQGHNFLTIEKQMRSRFRIALTEGTQIIVKLNLSPG